MSRILRGTFAGLVLFTLTTSVMTQVLPARYDIQVRGEVSTKVGNQAFADACTILEKTTKKYRCPSDLPVPAVLTADLADGLWGIYVRGGRVVYLNTKLVGPHYDVYAHAVLVHEMVHYIQAWAGFGLEVCDDEALAWSVYNTYVKSNNRRELVNKDWKRGYEQCQKPTQTESTK